MTEIEERILKYTQFWYEYVNTDHHKDRDCHFTIEKRWSYGEPPKYRFQHSGYVGEYVKSPTVRATYGEALRDMERWFEEHVKIARRWAYQEDDPEDWFTQARAEAREIIERYGF